MGHYYYRSGDTAYTVPYADGRPGKETTIVDARRLGLVPSVTEVLKVAPSFGLLRWKEGKHAIAGAENAHLRDSMTERQWLAMVRKEASQKEEEAADIGTILHDIIEAMVNNDPLPNIEFPIDNAGDFFAGFCEWWGGAFFEPIYTELPFAHPLGFGGKIDLCAVDSSGRDVILDWKTKDTIGKKLRYLVYEDSNPVQLRAYLEGYKHYCAMTHNMYVNDPRLINVIVSRDEPGRIEMWEWEEEEFDRYWSRFTGLLQAWKAGNKYDSAF